MKNILILFVAILMLSCNYSKKQKSNDLISDKEHEHENFDWLIGNWERTAEKEGKRTFEIWKKINAKEYVGIGFTMKANDTIWQETMRLVGKDGTWNFFAKAPNEAKPTLFKMTNHSNNEFTCENHEIEFPNKIKYWKNGDKINANVSNATMEIPFEFEKRKE